MRNKDFPHADQLELPESRSSAPAQETAHQGQQQKFPPECPVHGVPKVFTVTMTCRAGHVHRARKVYVWCPVCRKR